MNGNNHRPILRYPHVQHVTSFPRQPPEDEIWYRHLLKPGAIRPQRCQRCETEPGAGTAGPNRARPRQHRDCRPGSGCGGEHCGEGCRRAAGRDAARDAAKDAARDARKDAGRDAVRNVGKDASPPRAPAAPRGTHRRRGSLRGLVAPGPRSEGSA